MRVGVKGPLNDIARSTPLLKKQTKLKIPQKHLIDWCDIGIYLTSPYQKVRFLLSGRILSLERV